MKSAYGMRLELIVRRCSCISLVVTCVVCQRLRSEVFVRTRSFLYKLSYSVFHNPLFHPSDIQTICGPKTFVACPIHTPLVTALHSLTSYPVLKLERALENLPEDQVSYVTVRFYVRSARQKTDRILTWLMIPTLAGYMYPRSRAERLMTHNEKKGLKIHLEGIFTCGSLSNKKQNSGSIYCQMYSMSSKFRVPSSGYLWVSS